jgi:hypothetical protein
MDLSDISKERINTILEPTAVALYNHMRTVSPSSDDPMQQCREIVMVVLSAAIQAKKASVG